MKKFLKSILFLIIFAIIWNHVFSVLWLTENSAFPFFTEPKDTIDVSYVGSSNAYVHFNTVMAFHEYGFTVGMLSSGNQPVTTIKYLIKESEKRQNPTLYIIDLMKFAFDFSIYNEGDIRNSLDAIPFSKNKLDAIDYTLKYIDVLKNDPSSTSGNDKFNYYFSFLKYHNSWKELSQSNYEGDYRLYKSFYLSKGTTKSVKYEHTSWSEERKDLADGMQEVFEDLISYIQEENLNVLFVIPVQPYIQQEENVPERFNTMVDYVTEKGFKVINFNKVDDLGIDYSHDFHNQAHLNVYGSTKYTLWLSNYLKDNYELKDHRGDQLYRSWENEYELFCRDFNTYTNQNYTDLLKNYREKYHF